MPTISRTGLEPSMAEEHKQELIANKRQHLFEKLATELHALERMNPKVQLQLVYVRTYDRDLKKLSDYSLAMFISDLCIDAFLHEDGDFGQVVSIEVGVY